MIGNHETQGRYLLRAPLDKLTNICYHARMIRNWRYDDGYPIYSTVLKTRIGEERRPAWHCTIYRRDINAAEMQRWLEENLIEDEQFEITFRFNSGDPAMFVEIYDKDAAAAFYLVWGEDHG